MEFYLIKVQKYKGGIGEVKQLDIYLNINSISYIEKVSSDRLNLRLIGEQSNNYIVTDKDSLKILKKLANID